jgi:cytochrome P450 family 9
LQINSFENSNNDFLRIATKATNFATFSKTVKLALLLAAPGLMAKLKIKFLDDDFYSFFGEALSDTIKTREEKKISRNDMIDLILQAKHGKLTHDHEEQTSSDGFATVEESQLGKENVKRTWEDEELLAQCFGFFFAGFETVSSVMTFFAGELVVDPEIQKKLQNEIDEVFKSLDGETLTYEHVQKMKYMDMVLCEVLRKWPAAPITDRMCTKEFNLEYDDKKFTIEYDKSFYIPIYAIHHDERYYSNPEKFDPERFNDENKKNIRQDCYMPFGVGPR